MKTYERVSILSAGLYYYYYHSSALNRAVLQKTSVLMVFVSSRFKFIMFNFQDQFTLIFIFRFSSNKELRTLLQHFDFVLKQAGVNVLEAVIDNVNNVEKEILKR